MGRCAEGWSYYYAKLVEQTDIAHPQANRHVAKLEGNLLTGYYSDKAKCNSIEGANPGNWETPYNWHSACHGLGVKRELTQIDLMVNACSQYNNQAEEFCNSLEDVAGHSRKPLICGGSDPNQITFNPGVAAVEGLSDEFAALKGESDSIAGEIIMDFRKKTFAVAVLVIFLIVVVYLLLYIK